MMPFLIATSFALTDAGIMIPPYSSEVPLFFRVPVYVPPAKVPLAADNTAASTEDSTPLATVPTSHLQSLASVRQPFESTHRTEWPLPACLAAAMEPRPTEPATG